jgi:cation transport ATPase
MNKQDKSRRQQFVDWQNKYITPVLLVIGFIAVAASWGVGAISWGVAVIVLAFITFALVTVIKKKNR